MRRSPAASAGEHDLERWSRALISAGPFSPDRAIGSDQRRGKLRVAIGLFGSRDDACATARDLEQAGLAAERIGFAATPDLIDVETHGGRRPDGHGWLRYFTDDARPKGTFEVVAPRNAATTEFDAIGAALNDHLHRRSLRHQEHQLHGHLTSGGWLLVVRLDDESEQHAVCSTLLRRARFGVQSHEMRRA